MFDFQINICDDTIMITHARVCFGIVHQVYVCYKHKVQYIVHSSWFVLNLVESNLHSQI